MYKEVCKKKHGVFLGVIIIITAGFCLLSVPDWLENLLLNRPLRGEGFYEMTVLLVTAFVLLLYLRTFMTGYTYCLIDNEVIIRKIIGRREVTVADFRLNQIAEIGLEENAEKSDYSLRSASRFYNVREKKKTVYIVYTDNDGKTRILLFTPSERMFKIISDKILDKRGKM